MALLKVLDEDRALAERVAERFVVLTRDAAAARGAAMVCLTGGATPKRTYELLATEPWQKRLPWERVHVYWTDERHVPPDHHESNYGMA